LNSCHEVVSALEYELSDDVNLIWGLRTDDSMGSRVKVVMLVASIPESELEIEDVKESLTSLGESVQMIN
jgi:cell division GTPase FtsZ